jgi:MFS family permease
MSLWTAQIFSQFADRAVFVLFVAILTANISQTAAGPMFGAAQMTSILYVAFTIPAVVLSPVAGVYVDRWSNRTVLVLSNLMRAGCVCLLAFSYIKQSTISTLGLAFLISIGSQFFGPAETASIPRLVKKEDLYGANSLFFTTTMIALGFGFAIGEPIIEHTGIGGAPWAVAGCFLIAALLLTSIEDNKPSNVSGDVWWEELRFGISYIVNNPRVFRAILKITVLFSTIITLNIIAVGLAQQVMHIQPFQFGYIVAAAGVGMAVGNFWVGHYGRNLSFEKLVWGGFTSLGLFMSLLGSLGFLQSDVFPYFGVSEVYFNGWLMLVPLTLALCTGISCAFVAVPTQAALQEAVPEELRGKVFGAQNTAMSATSTIPVILAGISADNLPGGVSTTLLLIGLPTFFIAAYRLKRNSSRIKQV